MVYRLRIDLSPNTHDHSKRDDDNSFAHTIAVITELGIKIYISLAQEG